MSGTSKGCISLDLRSIYPFQTNDLCHAHSYRGAFCLRACDAPPFYRKMNLANPHTQGQFSRCRINELLIELVICVPNWKGPCRSCFHELVLPFFT